MAVSHHRISSLELFRRCCWCCRAFEPSALSDTESAGPVPGRLDLTGCVFHRDRSSNARQRAARTPALPRARNSRDHGSHCSPGAVVSRSSVVSVCGGGNLEVLTGGRR